MPKKKKVVKVSHWECLSDPKVYPNEGVSIFKVKTRQLEGRLLDVEVWGSELDKQWTDLGLESFFAKVSENGDGACISFTSLCSSPKRLFLNYSELANLMLALNIFYLENRSNQYRKHKKCRK